MSTSPKSKKKATLRLVQKWKEEDSLKSSKETPTTQGSASQESTGLGLFGRVVFKGVKIFLLLMSPRKMKNVWDNIKDEL